MPNTCVNHKKINLVKAIGGSNPLVTPQSLMLGEQNLSNSLI